MDASAYSPQLTPQLIAEALHLRISALPEVEFNHVTTDSRRVQPGSLFVALKGEQYDGNQFIEAAIQAGATGVVCSKGAPVGSHKGLALFQVDDSLSAFRKIAARWRKEFSIPIIVVAGSAGKTTTKEILTSLLKGRWKDTLKTQASQNGFVGIPMTLLELRSSHQAAVIEVGIDEIGAMAQHMNLINPTAAVLTAIGPEHLEKLIDVPTVAYEEGIALTHVAKNKGLVAISLDDPWIRPHASVLKDGQLIGFTLDARESEIPESMRKTTLRGHYDPSTQCLSFEGAGLPRCQIELPLWGKHNASNTLAAIAIASGLGLSREDIIRGLSLFQGASGRSEIQNLPGNTQVICDYYNAQPASVRAGLELLQQLSSKQSGKRWACLGDMLELGLQEEVFHREIAPQILQLQIENVLLYGPRMRSLFDELKLRHFSGRLEHFTSQAEMGRALTASVRAGDTLLIKGSRGMKMEELWKMLESFTKTPEFSLKHSL